MSDDPFDTDDDDKTVLRPSSLQRRSATPAKGQARTNTQALTSLPALSGINPLEKAASRLLPLLITLKNSSSHPDPVQLRNFLVNEIEDFKRTAHRILNDQKQVTQASYVLCTALDEAAMNTPWGHKANWAQHNLLTAFHNEVIGGERFFELLKKLGKNPSENIELLELMYVCLSLGYEGNYRIAQNGQNTLAKIKKWLYEIINNVRAAPPATLSLQWEGSGMQESKLPKLTVLWAICAVALALGSLVYIGYRYSLGAQSDNAIAEFFTIKPAALQVSSVMPPASPPTNNPGIPSVTLEQLLQPQIDLGLVEVSDAFDKGVVRILGNNLFASGRSELNPELDPLVQTIASAMNQFSGDILITGHSDNIPIRSGRFASNLELSRERAVSVAERMSTSMDDPARLDAEGRGSLEPIADNSSAIGRATNRRVEVAIFY